MDETSAIFPYPARSHERHNFIGGTRHRQTNWRELHCFSSISRPNRNTKFSLDKYGWDGGQEIKMMRHLMKISFENKWMCFETQLNLG